MRNLILLITLIGSILYSRAYAGNNEYANNYGISVTYENVDSLSSTFIKNNIKTKFFGEPSFELLLSLDEEKINFKVYSKTKVGNTYYLFGNGTYNIHIICVEGDKVSFPITNNRTMTLTNAQFAKSIRDKFDSIPEAYAKRMNSMIAGQGMFDEKTGEVSFGIASQQMMRQYAQSTGQDYKDVLNQARQQVKIGQINKNLSTEQGFTEEQQSLIANKAQYNKDSQQWEVTTLDGQVKNVNELTQTDMSNLGPEQGEDSQETMVELQTKMLEKLSTIYSRQETMENSQTELKSFLMGDGEAWAKLGEANDTITQTMRDEFFKNIDTYRRQVSDNLGIIKNAPSQFFKIWKAGNKEIDDATIEIKNSVQNIDKMLPNYWKEGQEFIGKCMSSMAQGMEVNFEIPEIKMPTDHKENRTDTEYKKDKNFFRDVISPAVTGATTGAVIGSTAAAASFGLTAVGGAIIGGLIGGGAGAYDYFFGDGIVNTNGVGEKINDGAIAQNGKVTRIDDNDQVLAAKSGGPIDKMVSTFQSVMPRPMRYDSYVSENPYGNGGGQVNGDGKIEISPIQININGNIQISGGNGTTDITQQLANDPNFIRSLSQMISLEVEKKVRGGRVNSPLNRGLEF